MKQRLLSVFAMLSLMISGVMAQTFTISTDCEGYFIAGDRVEVSINVEGAQEMTALQFNFSLPEGFTLSEGWPIYMGNATNGHAMNASILDSGDLFVVLYSLHSGTFDDGTLISFNVTAAEDAVSTQGKLYNVRTATTDAVSHTLSDVTFAMNIASEEPEPTWHLSGPATEEEITTQSYIDGLVYNQTTKPSTITLKKGYNVIIIPSSWTTPTFGFVSDFSKRYTPYTANDLGITDPSNKKVLVLSSEVENATCYVKWGTNVVPEPEPEPEPETAYYWYVGNGDEIAKGDASLGEIDWSKAQQVSSFETLGYSTAGTKITMNKTGENNVFILCPKSWSSKWQFWNVDNTIDLTTGFSEVSELLGISSFKKDNVEYDLWMGEGYAGNIAHIRATAVPEPEAAYYWYVGTSEPTELNGAVNNPETDKWVEIGGEMPSYINVETANKYDYWYVLMPTEFDFCPHNSDGSTDESVVWTSTTSSIPGYTLWSRNDKTLKLGTIFKKLGELPYNANSDYWYLGHIDPTTMTEINPINVNNIFFTEGGSWEELIDPSAMIELIVTPKEWDSESMKSLWYVAMPASSGYTPQDADLWETSTATIAGKDYIVYKSEGKVWKLNTAFLPEGYVEEEPVEPEPTPITSIEELNNVTLYYISLPNHKNGLVSWAAAENGLKMKSCADLGVAPDANDTKQQCAFISNDGGATRYLYHAAEKKFVAKDGSLCEYPHDALSFVAGAYEGTFVAYFDDSHYINVGGSSQMAVDSWTTADGGNSAVILPVGEYDPAEALAAFEKELPTVTGITSIDELSNEKLYYVSLPSHTNGLVSWAVNVEALKSSKDLGIISCPGNSFQQFAFINYGGAYYLYHAASKMFVGANGTLSDTPANTVSFSAGNADGTFVVYFDNDHYINVGGSNQMVINGWNTPDGGNSCVIAPVADFDPTEAIEAIKTTGIENSKLKIENSDVFYDLQGRRVTHPTKGIYIVGGKKVVIK